VPAQPLFLVFFLGLAFWLFAPAWSSPTTTTMAGGNGDPAIFIWFLRWTPFALEHGHDLLVAHHLNYPDGVNLMWNTSLVLPGLVLAPLTTRFGPVLTFNVVLVLAYGLSAWCAYLAIRRFVPGHLAPAVGGLVYGFSPAIFIQLHHPHMSLAFLVPLMLLALHEILVRQRRPPWLAGAALGLLAGCQLLTGEELLAMAGILGFVLFLLLLLGNLRRLRGRSSTSWWRSSPPAWCSPPSPPGRCRSSSPARSGSTATSRRPTAPPTWSASCSRAPSRRCPPTPPARG
jgi:hypothetical protein